MFLEDVFFFNDTATTEIYTLSLHDALPIWSGHLLEAGCRNLMLEERVVPRDAHHCLFLGRKLAPRLVRRDRKSTRLNSSHANISYAVFCLKKNNDTYLQYTVLYTHLFNNYQ